MGTLRPIFAPGLCAALLAAAAGCGRTAILSEIQVAPAQQSVARGATVQLTAIGTYTDQSRRDITDQVEWRSSDPALIAVGAQGRASALAAGEATIWASLSGRVGSGRVTVKGALLASLAIEPPVASIAQRTRQQFRAIGTFDDGSAEDLTARVTWSSSDHAVAVVSNDAIQPGETMGVAPGSARIDATLDGLGASAALTVSSATLQSIALDPPGPTIARGTSQRFRAVGTFSDSTTQDLTAYAAWWSSDTAVAAPAEDDRGLVHGQGAGTATIRATLGGKTGSTALTVTAFELVSLTLGPASPSLARGTALQLSATGQFADGSSQDLTEQVAWTSSNAAVASVSNTPGTRGRVQGLAAGTAQVSATLGATSGATAVAVTPAVLQLVSVTPAGASIAKGTTQPFTATGLYSDSTTQDLTGLAAWTSSAPAVASVSNASGKTGLATGAGEGTATITATYAGQSGSATLEVSAAALVSLTVTPASPSIAKGTTLPFAATGTYTDGTTQDLTAGCSWSSANPAVAQVSSTAPSKGLASAVGVGTALITANTGGTSGSATLTVTPALLVSVAITPADPTLATGLEQQFTATGTYSDASTQDVTALATWATSDAAVLSVSNAAGSQGQATALGQGSATLTASLGGLNGTSRVTVTAATLASISVTPTDPTIARGTTLPFTATGLYTDGTQQDLTGQATWTSAAPAVATVSNAAGSKGLASGVSAGTSAIRATHSGVTGASTLTVTAASLTSISVTPTTPALPKGTTLQFTATGFFSDGTRQDLTAQVTWSSTLPSVATISGKGLAAALATGTTRIRAVFGTGFGAPRGFTDLTVTPATLLAIDLTPASSSVAKGTSQPFTATGTYSDSTTQNITALATWSSSDPAVASVSNAAGSKGLVAAVAEGAASLSASLAGVSGATSLTVTAATLVSVAIAPSSATLPKGTARQLAATGTYSDLTTQDLTDAVTWSSSNGAVATVSNAAGSKGRASGVGVGSAVLSATLGGATGFAVLTVSPATLVSLNLTPAAPSVAQGLAQQFVATGLFSDDTTQDVTAAATWSSSDEAVAAVSNAAGTEGRTTTLAQGTVLIEASLSGLTGSATLTVTPATLVSVRVTPASASLAKGTALAFTATGVYSDGTTQALTTQASWSSSATTVATVSNAAGSQGLVTGAGLGTTQIAATFGGTSGSASLTVTAATLLSIALSPADQTIAAGTTLQLTATGAFSDGGTQDVTAQVAWSSSATSVATVSNAAGTKGLVWTAGAGSATITATLSGRSGATTVTVTPAPLLAIQVTPASAAVALGGTQQLRAIGTYADATQQDLTAAVTWSAQTPAVASVSNAAGSQGLATGLAPGSTVITASHAGQSGSAVLGVTAP